MKKIELVAQMTKRNNYCFSYFNVGKVSPIYYKHPHARVEDAGSYWNKDKWFSNIATKFRLELVYD